MTVRIDLDVVKKYRRRSSAEFRYVNRARGEGYESVGDGDNIQVICRQMRDAGLTGSCEVWRGDTLIFPALPIERWAEGKALSGKQPEHLKQ